MHAWVVTSYQEVVTVLMNYSADRTPPPAYLDRLGLSFMKPFSEIMLRQMMFMDGAMHSRLRSICAAAFTPRRVEGLRTIIESIANDLIEIRQTQSCIRAALSGQAPSPDLRMEKLR